MNKSFGQWIDRGRLVEIWRYYQVGIVNTVVGYGLFAAFVHLGLNIYVAQIVAHLIGMAFNYFSYTFHVFRGAEPAKTRFVVAYGVNYIIGLVSLVFAQTLVRSPYIAGVIAIVIASIINYFILRYAVFNRKSA